MADYSPEKKTALLEDRTPRALELLKSCTVCPRNCEIDRTQGETSHCGVDARLKVSSINLHFGEEPPVSGRSGSGELIYITGLKT